MLEAMPQMRQYQFEQTAVDAITVRLFCVPAPSNEQLRQFQAALEQMLGHAYRWTWQVGDTPLPLSARSKFEEFISSIQATGEKA
ncbi:MAG: hypothetical protein K6T56_06420 [Burkholderiales bacterium]|nr:hypothetical protein [Burkholderiales bacterium]